jgi:hypothetical protein
MDLVLEKEMSGYWLIGFWVEIDVTRCMALGLDLKK